MEHKKQLGQFFTKNSEQILQGFEKFVKNKNVLDPFAGDGDLLQWAEKNKAKTMKGFDIDEKYIDKKQIFYNNSLKNPVKANFILTNPPYLYQNKMADNALLKKSKHTDVYQIALEKIMNSKEGIAIVPVNFLSSENAKYIRKKFFGKFEILKVNYFTEAIFEDTTYNVIAFYYRLKNMPSQKMRFEMYILPQKEKRNFILEEKHNWKIGGGFIQKIKNCPEKINISRLEEKNIITGKHKILIALNHVKNTKKINVDSTTFEKIHHNIILLKCIDTGTKDGKICLEDIRKYKIKALVGKTTSRNQAHIIFSKKIPLKTQEKIIQKFNFLLNEKRKKYDSLFLTNFRDKNRKRMSFKFCYEMINYVYFKKVKK